MALDIRHRSLVFSGVGQIPPATAVNYVPWAIIGFIFQYVVRRKHFSYWAKYNCEFSVCRAGVGSAVPAWARLAGCLWFFFAFVIDVLSAALDAGTAVGVILVFFWCVVFFVLSEFLVAEARQSAISVERQYRETQHTRMVRALFPHLRIGWADGAARRRWGNTVYMDTLDWNMTSLRTLAKGHTFGCVFPCLPSLRRRLTRCATGPKYGRLCIYFVSLAGMGSLFRDSGICTGI